MYETWKPKKKKKGKNKYYHISLLGVDVPVISQNKTKLCNTQD